MNDTIVALATPVGESAVAIVRLSGSAAFVIADRLFRTGSSRSLVETPSRRLVYGRIEIDDEILDDCLVVLFRAPRSYTGEDLVEFQLHGNPLIVDRVIELSLRYGARAATPGEFTRRAFVNGKMNLMQAESVAAVISAESEQAVILAQRQHHGDTGRRLSEFRRLLVDALARLELELDFIEDGYAFMSSDEVFTLLSRLESFVCELLASAPTADRLSRGPRILLLGRPNAGKSSLFNAMIGFRRALVSPIEGTTRDYLEERVIHQGVTLRFVDSAGLREAGDALETEGIERAKELIPLCDRVLYLIDSSDPVHASQEVVAFHELRDRYPETAFTLVWSKVDKTRIVPVEGLQVSIVDADSVRRLIDDIIRHYSTTLTSRLVLLNRRQSHLLSLCLNHVQDALELVQGPTEILSAQVRSVLRPLSELTGEVTNDDILDAVFSSFCIGK